MNDRDTTIALLGIGTALPPHRLVQEEVVQRLVEALTLADHAQSARWARRIFRQCGVETRYTCEANLLESASGSRYALGTPKELIPGTGERMALYKQHAVPLALEASRRALRDAGVEPAEVTHLMTVSCTGMFLPGLDVTVAKELDLSPVVKRMPHTFMGCAAGMSAIRHAREVVEANPDAKVLIACVELCTIHMQPSGDKEDLFGAAFFGDGASACVVGKTDFRRRGAFALGESRAVMLPDSMDEMVWDIGDNGFLLHLSPRIPELIGAYVPPEIETLLSGERASIWAIHPGGRGIIDALQSIYELTDAQTAASRTILRDYGNMSSATILFVLDEMRRELEGRAAQQREDGIALAFGPGLVAELIRIVWMPAL